MLTPFLLSGNSVPIQSRYLVSRPCLDGQTQVHSWQAASRTWQETHIAKSTLSTNVTLEGIFFSQAKIRKVVQKIWQQRNAGLCDTYYSRGNYSTEKFAFWMTAHYCDFTSCYLTSTFIVPPKLSNQLWQLKKVFLLLRTRNSAKYALLSPQCNDLYKLKIAIFYCNDSWTV